MTLALNLVRASAGNKRAAKIAMMAMTTSNSIKVKPAVGGAGRQRCSHLLVCIANKFIKQFKARRSAFAEPMQSPRAAVAASQGPSGEFLSRPEWIGGQQ